MRLGQSPAVLKRHVTSHVLWTWPLTWHFYSFLGFYSFSCVPCTLDMAVSKPRLPSFGRMPHVAASRLGALRLRDEAARRPTRTMKRYRGGETARRPPPPPLRPRARLGALHLRQRRSNHSRRTALGVTYAPAHRRAAVEAGLDRDPLSVRAPRQLRASVRDSCAAAAPGLKAALAHGGARAAAHRVRWFRGRRRGNHAGGAGRRD